MRARDQVCVYCARRMRAYPHTKGTPSDKSTIEHLGGPPVYPNYPDEPRFDRGSVAICCGSCNSSRGAVPITDWFKMPYCVERGVGRQSVAPVIQSFIRTRRYWLYRQLWWVRQTRKKREGWQARHGKLARLRP